MKQDLDNRTIVDTYFDFLKWVIYFWNSIFILFFWVFNFESAILNPESSILGPLLFNIFICDMFYFLEDFDIANYVVDSTPYCLWKSAEFVVNNMEQSSAILCEWLNNDYMKVKAGKSHLLLSGNSRAAAMIDNNCTESEDEQVLLGTLVRPLRGGCLGQVVVL